MNSLLEKILTERKGTTEEALQVFDKLPPASLEFMHGRWKGSEIETGHPMEGLLTQSGWYGKIFENNEEVHPLVVFGKDKKELYSLNPAYLPLDFKLPKSDLLGTLMNKSRIVLETKESKARLRNMEYRGKVCATMAYDEKPIFDMFAKIDDKRVLGVMDFKGDPNPYFFMLERDDDTAYEIAPFKAKEKKFMELFDMEVQNRAFALKACINANNKSSTEGDKIFFGAWLDFEQFLQKKYAPFAEKYALSQEPRSMAKIQAGLGEIALNILPDSVMREAMREQTIKYLEKLKELQYVAPKEDAGFFDFVVKQEELQIDALQFWVDENNEAAAKLLRNFIEENQ
ncbi:MAG: DUF4334 domain-containing protein [Bacteroidota bacterium]